MSTPTKRRNRIFSETFTAEVEVSADDLEEAGWHHEDDCPNDPDAGDSLDAVRPRPVDTLAVIASLHRQAHPSQHSDPLMCHEEPCRSIPLDALRQR